MRKENNMYHQPNNEYGENLFMYTGTDLSQVTPEMAFLEWYNECELYNYDKEPSKISDYKKIGTYLNVLLYNESIGPGHFFGENSVKGLNRVLKLHVFVYRWPLSDDRHLAMNIDL